MTLCIRPIQFCICSSALRCIHSDAPFLLTDIQLPLVSARGEIVGQIPTAVIIIYNIYKCANIFFGNSEIFAALHATCSDPACVLPISGYKPQDPRSFNSREECGLFWQLVFGLCCPILSVLVSVCVLNLFNKFITGPDTPDDWSRGVLLHRFLIYSKQSFHIPTGLVR